MSALGTPDSARRRFYGLGAPTTSIPPSPKTYHHRIEDHPLSQHRSLRIVQAALKLNF
jgi:hypothetical protein